MRILTLLLAALAGCATASGDGTEILLTGVAQRDITPPMGYGMSGYYHARGADGLRDPLHAKAIVFRQGAAAAALVMCDVSSIATDLADEARRRASEKTGIPVSAIGVAATHTHTGPQYQADLKRWLEQGRPAEGYIPKLIDGIAGAVIDAHAALKPRQLDFVLGRQEPEVSFNRRFVMKDGSIKTWANYTDPNVVRAAGPIDPEISVILVRDPAAKRDVAGLINFPLHLDTLGGTQWSADFPYDIGESLKQDLGPDFLTIFANGCCGDINHSNPRAKERNKTDFIGQAIAASVKRALPQRFPLGAGALAARATIVRAPIQDYSDADLEKARAIIEQGRKGTKIPFLEVVWAHKVDRLEALRRAPKNPARRVNGSGDSMSLEVQAFRIDRDTALVTLPGEVFVELGLAIKKASPFKRTMVVELANASETHYIPTREQYPGGGYEATNSVLKPGGGELLVEAALGLLKDLAGAP